MYGSIDLVVDHERQIRKNKQKSKKKKVLSLVQLSYLPMQL